MESLESKLDRLSPDQRREVEDFVDFLLYRAGSPYGVSRQPPVNPPVFSSVPPVIPVMTPLAMQENVPVVTNEPKTRSAAPSFVSTQEEHYSPVQEITVEIDDRISRDYMDYGQFDKPQSPATEAVKKVKAKLIQKSEMDTSRHLLEWID